jgi:hypothetical protein
MTSPADFCHAGYAALLDGFAARGYQATTYSDVDPERAHLVLRHDLDMSIQAARPIADIEAARGMRGHYFVLLRTEMYNPWSRAGRADLVALAEGGHDIGLHLDAALYADDVNALDRACGEECDALEQLLGRAVSLVSLHRPRRGLLDRSAGAGTPISRRSSPPSVIARIRAVPGIMATRWRIRRWPNRGLCNCSPTRSGGRVR